MTNGSGSNQVSAFKMCAWISIFEIGDGIPDGRSLYLRIGGLVPERTNRNALVRSRISRDSHKRLLSGRP